MTEKYTGHTFLSNGFCGMCRAKRGDLEPCPARVPRTDNPISEGVRADKERAWDIASKLHESEDPDLKHLAVQYMSLWTVTRCQKAHNDMLENLVPKKLLEELFNKLFDEELEDVTSSSACIDGIYKQQVHLGGYDFEVHEEECEGCEDCNGWKPLKRKVPPTYGMVWVYIEDSVIPCTYTEAYTGSLGDDHPAMWFTDCWSWEALPEHKWKPYTVPDPPK